MSSGGGGGDTRAGGGIPILVHAIAKATGKVLIGVFTGSMFSSAININFQKQKIKNGKQCGLCKGKGFYKCKLCKGTSAIQWSPLYDVMGIRLCAWGCGKYVKWRNLKS